MDSRTAVKFTLSRLPFKMYSELALKVESLAPGGKNSISHALTKSAIKEAILITRTEGREKKRLTAVGAESLLSKLLQGSSFSLHFLHVNAGGSQKTC